MGNGSSELQSLRAELCAVNARLAAVETDVMALRQKVAEWESRELPPGEKKAGSGSAAAPKKVKK